MNLSSGWIIEMKSWKNRTIYQLLEGVLNYKLVNVLLKLSKVRSQDKWKDIDNNLKIAIAKNIVSWN